MSCSAKEIDLTTNYPRDMVGYANHPPHAQWPNQAKIAVQFVLNYEEGGEKPILHGDEGSEQFLSEISGVVYMQPVICLWIRCMNMVHE